MHFLLWFISLGTVRQSVSVEYVKTEEDLRTVPRDIPPETEVLNLAKNLITVIEYLPVIMERLQEFHLTENLLSEFPNLRNCSNVKKLFLKNNKISYIDPGRLNALTKLEWLALASNNLHLIPDVPGPGESMDGLGLSRNNFTSMPVLQLLGGTLTKLYIHNNDISTLAQSHLQPLRHLETLSISHNRLLQIPALGSHAIPYLRSLSLHDNPDLAVIPFGLFPAFPAVEVLKLYATAVMTVPNPSDRCQCSLIWIYGTPLCTVTGVWCGCGWHSRLELLWQSQPHVTVHRH